MISDVVLNRPGLAFVVTRVGPYFSPSPDPTGLRVGWGKENPRLEGLPVHHTPASSSTTSPAYADTPHDDDVRIVIDSRDAGQAPLRPALRWTCFSIARMAPPGLARHGASRRDSEQRRGGLWPCPLGSCAASTAPVPSSARASHRDLAPNDPVTAPDGLQRAGVGASLVVNVSISAPEVVRPAGLDS